MAAPESIRSDVHLVRIPMPGGGLPFSLCYLLEDAEGRIHVIDPGSPGPLAVALIDGALHAIGKRLGDVSSILVTHLHSDHAGAAAALRAATGAPVLMHERERDALAESHGAAGLETTTLDDWGVPADRRAELLALPALPVDGVAAPDAVLTDGQLLDIPGRRVRALWTPGHTAGHLCFDDEDRGVLFTGDHILPTVNPGLGLGGPATDPIGDYLTALRRVAALDREALPGHEGPFPTLAERCAELAEHHLRRARQVQATLRLRPGASVWEVAATLTWTGGWEALAGFTLASALAQTAMHRAFVRSGAAIAW
ncbi:MBL fold metallo-hydrolase [Leifsonia sp. NPDC058194]|uniref:MBL fold metallo-hydrolase n=1 Tax=Leifsonia sp. NPDC058194 TaxID=3346374 RepID=UPI0036DE8891